MQTTILKKLMSLLESNPNLVVEGLLNKNKVAELARKYDTGLLDLLQNEDEVKKHFFPIQKAGWFLKRMFCYSLFLIKNFCQIALRNTR